MASVFPLRQGYAGRVAVGFVVSRKPWPWPWPPIPVDSPRKNAKNAKKKGVSMTTDDINKSIFVFYVFSCGKLMSEEEWSGRYPWQRPVIPPEADLRQLSGISSQWTAGGGRQRRISNIPFDFAPFDALRLLPSTRFACSGSTTGSTTGSFDRASGGRRTATASLRDM